MTFGEYVKSLREARKMTLKKFCELAGVDYPNQSKIERNILKPPSESLLKKIKAYAKALDITQDSEEFFCLYTMANLQNRKFRPLNLDIFLAKKLLLFISILDSKNLTTDKLNAIMYFAKKELERNDDGKQVKGIEG